MSSRTGEAGSLGSALLEALPSVWASRAVDYAPRERIQRQGRDTVCFVVRGWAGQERLMADGRRLIVELLLPGEHSAIRGSAHDDEEPVAIDRCSVIAVTRDELDAAVRASPDLCASLEASERRRVAVQRERVVSLGRRPAVARTAHLFCELLHRSAAGLGPGAECDLPLTQADLADVLGLSVVHVNRTVQVLREQKLISLHRGRLRAPDLEGLAQAGAFSRAYLL